MTKLCDLLKAIQLSQTHHQPGPGSHNSQAAIRTVQSDEFQTLLCLKVWRVNWARSEHHMSSFFSIELQILFVHKSTSFHLFRNISNLSAPADFYLLSEGSCHIIV